MALLDFLKRKRPEAALPISSKIAAQDLADAHSPADSSAAGVAGLPRIAQNDELPSYRSLLTAMTGALPVPERHQHEVALLAASPSEAVLVCLESYYGSSAYFSLCERARRAGYSISRELIAEDSGVLLIEYSRAARASTGAGVDAGEESLSAQIFEELVTLAVDEGSSDIHIAIREDTGAVLLRIDGRLRLQRKFPSSTLNDAVGFAFTKLAAESSRSHSTYNSKQAQSCSVPMRIRDRQLKLRYQSFPVAGGQDVTLRLLFTDGQDGKILSLTEGGYSEDQVAELNLAVRKSVGAIFVAGVTGSGKTTTLNTLMQGIPGRAQLKLYAIEDPSEYKMFGVSQVSVQRDAADQSSGNPFIGAMRTILRADPDVIMVGEVRDRETGSMLKGMIQSGHRVLTTVHAPSGIEIVERLTSDELGLSRQTLSARNFVSAFVYQRLVPLTCPHCGLPASEHLPAHTQRLLQEKFGISMDGVRIMNPQGCPHCKGRGSKGLTVAAEVIVPSLEMLQLIREGKDLEVERLWRQTRVTAFTDGNMKGKTAFEHALYKMSQGLVDPNVVESDFEPFESYNVLPLR